MLLNFVEGFRENGIVRSTISVIPFVKKRERERERGGGDCPVLVLVKRSSNFADVTEQKLNQVDGT